jgi:hypothetical protein
MKYALFNSPVVSQTAPVRDQTDTPEIFIRHRGRRKSRLSPAKWALLPAEIACCDFGQSN